LKAIHLVGEQLKAQGPSRTCNESKEEEEEQPRLSSRGAATVRAVPRGNDALRIAVIRRGFPRGDDEDLNVRAPRDGPGG